MKLPKNYFENLSTVKYREYLKLLPNMRKESTKAITMLIFTFVALSFLGIFAINPTLVTITELQKQLDESKFVYRSLTTKINNLSSLQQQYDTLSDDLSFVFDAIPQNPSAPSLIGQIEALADKQNIKITSLRVNKVELSKIIKPDKESFSYTFALEANGEYSQLTNFTESLININRIIVVESISLIKDTRTNLLVLSIQGRGYFKQ